MDREVLAELGCEELPASWLPGLTSQLGDRMAARLGESRLTIGAPVESYSTPRRLSVWIARLADRQPDLEELLTGPPVTAAFGADGRPTPAAVGFARKQGVAIDDLERADTPKGTYLAFRKHQRGKAAVDVLPDVLGQVLRDLTFPKLMRWDAILEDGRGELLFGRPIRWIVFLFGGRVVPFSIKRSEPARSALVRDVTAGAVTYGHRFLATTGRPGRALRIRTFDEYRARLRENFVVLDRQDRQETIARELDSHARRLGGRVSTAVATQSALLQEVPDLVEYPSVAAGAFDPAFLQLPDEVLTTTMIHHQHFFPVVDESGRLKPAFLAVTNTEAGHEAPIARNAERVLAARLRDARFFWDVDRRTPLSARVDRLDTILFHKKLGSYKAKAERIGFLARWIAETALGVPAAADAAALAGRLAKADLATDMVRELTELQGTMGGIYAREEGHPEQVWRAIYAHYLPVGIEASSAPARQDLGDAAVTWAAVSLADKLDTIVSLFGIGEEPTGSRDPYGLRRQAHGIIKVLVDLPELTGLSVPVSLLTLVAQASNERSDGRATLESVMTFFRERLRHVFERRGFAYDEINAVLQDKGAPDESGARARSDLVPLDLRRRLEALQSVRGSENFRALAFLFKRVKNIAPDQAPAAGRDLLNEPAERALLEEIERLRPVMAAAAAGGDYRTAFREASTLRPVVDRFFIDILVMAEDPALRDARLALMAGLRDVVLSLADISEIVSQ